MRALHIGVFLLCGLGLKPLGLTELSGGVTFKYCFPCPSQRKLLASLRFPVESAWGGIETDVSCPQRGLRQLSCPPRCGSSRRHKQGSPKGPAAQINSQVMQSYAKAKDEKLPRIYIRCGLWIEDKNKTDVPTFHQHWNF